MSRSAGLTVGLVPSSTFGPCPKIVALARSGAAQSVTRTIAATNGGIASVNVTGINIDRVVPAVGVAGVTGGRTYFIEAPNAVVLGATRCRASRRVTSREQSTAVGSTTSRSPLTGPGVQPPARCRPTRRTTHSPARRRGHSAAFHQTGDQRWALGLPIDRAMLSHRLWSTGVEVGHVL